MGRCVGRCGGVSLSTRPQRGSTEKEPEEPERTKSNERTRKEKPALFGRYPVSAVPFGRYRQLAVLFWRYFLAVSTVGGTFLAEAVKPEYGGHVMAVGGFSFFGGNTLAVGGIPKMRW